MKFCDALKIAKEKRPDVTLYTEFENGYVFAGSDDDDYCGGDHTPVVVTHEGKVTTMNAFVIAGTGALIAETRSIENA